MSKRIPKKLCRVCGQVKPVTEFHKTRARPDGFSWRCKICQRAHVKAIALDHIRQHDDAYYAQVLGEAAA